MTSLATKERAFLRKAALWLPAVAWYVVIFLFSAQTGAESSQVSTGVLTDLFLLDLDATPWELFLILSRLVRKAAHAFVYFVLTGLLLLPLNSLISRPKTRYAAALGLCAVLAALDEFHQTFVPGRSGRVGDVLIDLSGSVCFLLLWVLLRWFLKRRREKTK